MSELIRREFPAALETTGDGRTLELRVVPWNTTARVTDNGRDFYDEEWLPGCFDRQLDAPNRIDVLMNFEHEKGIGGVVGRGTELRNATDGFEGTFRMLNAADADKALELVNEGILTGVSLEAEPIRTERVDGIVKRVKARLVNVALCRNPAFPMAQVMAVREKQDDDNVTVTASGSTANLGEAFAQGVAESMEAIRVATRPKVPPPDRSELEEKLERIGVEAAVKRAVVKTPWNGAASRFDDEQYQRSCLIDRGGDAPPKERCSLPVLEPNGDLNVNAMHAAAARMNQVQASPQLKAAAARKLVRYYRQAGETPPEMLTMMAGR